MVEVENIVKHYGSIKAVNGISFNVKKGEVLGFLGPNGAGKSTTMKMITCFLTPTSGTAKVNGFDIIESPIQVKEQIGYLPESAPLYDEMTVDKFLAFIAEVRGFHGRDSRMRVDRVSEICQLNNVLAQPIHTLSKGFRQRVCFAQALIHDPSVLILDEPTDGLDPNQKQAVRDLIASMKDDKVIILSTHILEEVDAICSRALIISEGIVKIDGTPNELKAKSEINGAIVITLNGETDEVLKSDIKALESVKRVEQLNGVPESKYRLRCYPTEGKDLAQELALFLSDKKITAEEFKIEEGRLDEVFRKITRTV
jgi:ABC-2 type transport system ATP-binding protein